MENILPYSPPFIVLVILISFAWILWSRQIKSVQDRGKDTKDHSERIYKLFEFYIKIMLAITGGMGFVRLKIFDVNPIVGREAMIGLGWISLGVMTMFVIFLWCHQGSKLRRWKDIEWGMMPFWQELWMGVGMYSYGAFLWFVGRVW